MSQFMALIELPPFLTEEFIATVPRQRAHVATLLEQGVITTYALALDRSRLWVGLIAQDLDEARNILADFPLHKYMQVELLELAFHEGARAAALPKISLN